jgi:hypothetical protein
MRVFNWLLRRRPHKIAMPRAQYAHTLAGVTRVIRALVEAEVALAYLRALHSSLCDKPGENHD